MITYKTFILLPGLETNTYLFWDGITKQAAIIDPALPSQELSDFITDQGLAINYIINTHGHADHIGGNSFFHNQFNAPVCIHADDAEMLISSKLNLSAYLEYEMMPTKADLLLDENSELLLGNERIKIIHTPGHTKGGICLLIDNLLFSGDTLFYLDIGRTDLPGGNYEALLSSIRKKLIILPDDTVVLPGHGPASTIGIEKLNNPYL